MFCKDSYLSSDRWVFDELHKYRQWRNYLKGLYDQYRTSKGILYRSHFGFSPKVMFGGTGIVTGSARLDYYRYSGDSLQGWYHYPRLHPLSIRELDITTSGDFN